MIEQKIKNGIIHVHSENSLKDSSAKVTDICQKAAEYGAPAVVLTDHGTLTGTYDFIAAAKECGIKAIPGCEIYYEEDNSLLRRAHALIIPKDIIGFREMSKVVTESNSRLDSMNIPRVNFEILTKYFGEGTKGHGHIFFTSACMGGVLSSIILSNKYLEKDIKKIDEKMKRLYSPNSPAYLKNIKKIADLEDEISQKTERINELQKLAKKTFKKKIKEVESKNGTPEYEELKAELDAEMEECKNASSEAELLKQERQKIKLQQKQIKDRCKEEEKDHAKWNTLEEKKKELEKALSSEEELYKQAKETAKQFESIFGKGNFYVELQYHGIEEEAYVMPILAKLADEMELPIVVTNDAHMVGNSSEELMARQLMRSLRFNKWEEMLPSDSELYIKTDDELATKLAEILPSETITRGFDGIKNIVDACNVDFTKESHYPKFKSPITGEISENCLRRLAYEGISWRYPEGKGWTEKHAERLEYELKVIKQLGVCDYLCIVEDFLRYGRLLGKLDMDNPDPRYLADPYNIQLLQEITKDEVGLGIGPGRGSAVGSLVCYLIGITSVDPMKYNLFFERFLNTERVTMPDIDSDFKPDIRNKVLDYVKHVYGEEAVCCIMTKGTQQAKAAIRNCARLLGSERFDDTKVYLSLGDKIAKAVPKKLNIKLSDCWDELVEQFGEDKDAMTILNRAKLIEGTFTNIGMHAAGVIISDNGDVKEYVPLMYITGTSQFATQCDKEQAEELGLLKMDFLGLRNLGIITETLKLVKQRYGINIDMQQVPMEPEVFSRIFATGATNSVFQFESNGMKQMLRQFKPGNIEDVILLVAAYRPGPMQYLDSIIAVKNGKKKPDYVIPEMEIILGTTYGYPVYQEQIMQIFNRFAGFSLGESDIIRRYMSKKKAEKFMKYKDKFIQGMIERGGEPEKVEEFWNQLIKFAEYAFNKSHAAAYAFVAYYTAWLKYHYPKEYLCAVMNDTEFEKLSGLMNDCKNFGIQILPPDINESQNKFCVQDDAIFCGLGNVKNVGESAEAIIAERNANGPYTSFENFIIRTRCRKDVVESLILAGAFDKFSRNRSSLKAVVADYIDLAGKITAKEEKIIIVNNQIDELEAKYENLEDMTNADAKEQKKLVRTRNIILNNLQELRENIKNIAVDTSDENGFLRLQAEKEMIGAYVSGHPLDSYKSPKELKCTPINELTPKTNCSIMGMITNLRLTKRKSDGAGLAFFTLEDLTSSINVCCFSKAFKEYGNLIKENAVMQIKGKCFEDEDGISDNEDEVVLKFSVDSISIVEENKPSIILSVPSIMKWVDEIYVKVRPYQDKNGCPLCVYDRLTGKFRTTNMVVSREILKNTLGMEVSID